MSVIRMGSTNTYSSGWDTVFGSGKVLKKSAAAKLVAKANAKAEGDPSRHRDALRIRVVRIERGHHPGIHGRIAALLVGKPRPHERDSGFGIRPRLALSDQVLEIEARPEPETTGAAREGGESPHQIRLRTGERPRTRCRRHHAHGGDAPPYRCRLAEYRQCHSFRLSDRRLPRRSVAPSYHPATSGGRRRGMSNHFPV